MAIHTAAIQRPYIQRFSGGRRMARKHMNMALLARHVRARRHKLGIVRTVRGVTAHAILANRRVFPEKRAPLFGMTAVASIIDRLRHEHLLPFAAMGVVTRCAADLRVALLSAKQMG